MTDNSRLFVAIHPWSTTMASIIDQLLVSPKLALYVEQINALLNAERERREAFYEHMSEQEKVEFINGDRDF
jgi:hypothetical protein